MKRSSLFASLSWMVFSAFSLTTTAFADTTRFSTVSGGPSVSLSFSNGSESYALRALENTYSDFLTGGKPVGSSAAAPSKTAAAPAIVVDPDIFNFDNASYQLRRAFEVKLMVEQDWKLGKRFSAYGSVAAFAGVRKYQLPEGAGILTDPIDVKFATLGLELRGGLRHKQPLGARLNVQTEFGVGVQHIRVITRVQSALLDVSSTSLLTRPFVELGVSLNGEIRAVHWQTFAHLRGHKDKTADILFGVKFGL